jgi:hypothetical protein
MNIPKVRPNHKKRRKQEICNYSPISIFFSKIPEISMYIRVVAFPDKHYMISEVQNGCREKFMNTITQTLIEDIQKELL